MKKTMSTSAWNINHTRRKRGSRRGSGETLGYFLKTKRMSLRGRRTKG